MNIAQSVPPVVMLFRKAMGQSEEAQTRAYLVLLRSEGDESLLRAGGCEDFRQFIERFKLGTWSKYATFRRAEGALGRDIVTAIGVRAACRIASAPVALRDRLTRYAQTNAKNGIATTFAAVNAKILELRPPPVRVKPAPATEVAALQKTIATLRASLEQETKARMAAEAELKKAKRSKSTYQEV